MGALYGVMGLLDTKGYGIGMPLGMGDPIWGYGVIMGLWGCWTPRDTGSACRWVWGHYGVMGGLWGYGAAGHQGIRDRDAFRYGGSYMGLWGGYGAVMGSGGTPIWG